MEPTHKPADMENPRELVAPRGSVDLIDEVEEHNIEYGSQDLSEVFYNPDTKSYWLKGGGGWTRAKARDVKLKLKLDRDIRLVLFRIQWHRSIDLLGPSKAQKAKLLERPGNKCLVAEFPNPVINEEELAAALRLDRHEWYLDVDGRGLTIATTIVKNKWEDAIPQIVHVVTIFDMTERGFNSWKPSSYEYYYRGYKGWLKDWLSCVRQKGGVTK